MSLTDHSPLLLSLVLFLFVTIPIVSCRLSTIAISHVSNQTIVCALLPSHASKRFELNCTSIAKRVQRNYPSANNSCYTAIAAGDGFLCALSSIPFTSVSTMRWWEFKRESGNSSIPESKRVYRGSPLLSLSAGDTHVCGLQGGTTRRLECWRWGVVLPEEQNFTDIAVGEDFVCGLSSASQQIRCFGNDSTVVSHKPNGSYVALAAGSQHACAVSKVGELVCWGIGAPEVERNPFEISSLALGENRTCALGTNGTVKCWGKNSQLPNGFSKSQFVAIEAKGNALCGILMANYSLVCWGSEIFKRDPLVFNRVLPGACVPMSSCSCILAGSANICSNGAGIGICETCRSPPQVSPAPPPPPPPGSNSAPPPPSSSSSRRRLVFIVIGSVSLAVILSAAAIWFIVLPIYRNNGRIHDTVGLHAAAAAAPLPPGEPSERVRPNVAALSNLPINRQLSIGHSSTKEFPLAVLLAATDNFSDGHKIGSGSFGSVYRAVLDDSRVVAIKRADPLSAAAATAASTSHADHRRRRDRDREAAFLAELALLSRVNHKNLVRLLGFCNQDGERILVYEFMANGTLHDHLHKLAVSPLASWGARLRVALDAARGIEYLHAYAVPPIIHRDIKSSNILLDATWTAKVADFGLSLLSPSSDDEDTRDLSSPRAAGTVGYMDPQYYRLQHLTTKSDVYSFGVVLLELLTGCRAVHRNDDSGTPTNLVEYAVPHIDADDVHRVMDRRLPPPTPSEIETVAFVGYLAADCVSPDGEDRPTMSEIVSGLERAMAACAGQAPPALSRSATARSF